MRRKKGALSVFLTLILISFIMAVGVIAEGAAGKAARSYGGGVMELAGQSILSEFARELKQDYGLLGFAMGKAEVEEKMQWYGENSFHVDRGKMDLLQLELKSVSVDMSRYSLINPDVLEQQIREYMKFRVPEIVLSGALGALGVLEGAGDKAEGQRKRKTEEEGNGDTGTGESGDAADRRLKNQAVIASLPSRIHGVGGSLLPELESLPDLSTLFSNGKENLYTNLYILNQFRHTLDDPEWGETFFRGELEYILAGRLEDEGNRRSVKAALITLRAGINLVHIYGDSAKREAVMEAAAVLTPGPEAAITQAALAVAWAAAEAGNDISRLMRGGKVPLHKTEEDWMIDLESVLNNLLQGQPLEPEADKGMNYEDYLFLLLCFEDRDTKLIRIMDLIQLNFRGRYDGDFSIAACFSGFDTSVTLWRKRGFMGLGSLRSGIFTITRNYYPEEKNR